MDALPYVDSLFKEYLLFRGFTATLQVFNRELAQDKASGFQAERITELIFRKLIPELQVRELVEFLDFLNMRFYSRLDMKFESTCRRMEVSILRYLLVKAVKLNRRDKVQEFFEVYGNTIMSAKDPEDWRPWFCLAYVPQPHKDPTFQVYFTNEWVEVLEVSYRNFISEVLRILPLPAVLRFNTDRLARQHLQQQVEALQCEIRALQRQQSVHPSPSLSSSASLQSESSGPPLRRSFVGPKRGLSLGDEDVGIGEGALQARQEGRAGESAFVETKKNVFTKVRTRPDLPVVPEQDSRSSPPVPPLPPKSPSPTSPLSPAHSADGPAHHRREASLADWTGPEGFETLIPTHFPLPSAPGTPPGSTSGPAPPEKTVDFPSATASGNGTDAVTLAGKARENSGSNTSAPADAPTSPTSTPTAQYPSDASVANESPTASISIQPQKPLSSAPNAYPLPPSSALSTSHPTIPPVPLAVVKRTSSGGALASLAAPTGGANSPSAYAILDSYVKSTQHASPRRMEEGDVGIRGKPGALPSTAENAVSSELRNEAHPPAGETDPRYDVSSSDTTSTSYESYQAPSRHSMRSMRNSLSSSLAEPFLDLLQCRSERVVRGSKWELVLKHDDMYMEHSHSISCCRMSPTGANSATASFDGAVSIWTPPRITGNPARNTTLNIGACVPTLTWDERADKVMLVGTSGKGIKAWHVDTKRWTADIPCDPSWPDVLDIACCPTDPMFVCSSTSSIVRRGTLAPRGRVTLWNMRAFRKVQTFMIPGDPVATCVCYSRSGRLVATACIGGKLNIFDTSGGRAQPEKSWQVGPSGSRVFVRFMDATVLTFCGGKVQEWALQGARTPIRTFDLSSVCSDQGPVVEAANCHRFAISPDQSILAATTDMGDLALVDLHSSGEDSKAVSLLKLGMPRGLCAVDWHPLEDVLLCGSVAGPVSTLSFERSSV